jgi:hypothetical protein
MSLTVRKLAVVAMGIAWLAIGSPALAARHGSYGPTYVAPSGDFEHTPAPEQKAHTPLPIYAEIESDIARARVKYKGAGMSDWARVEMKRMGKGWGALIPCNAVTPGKMRYFIQGMDSEGDVEASSGDPKHPYEVPIRRGDIASEAPHLPGRAAPQTCDENTPTAPANAEHENAEHEEEPAEQHPAHHEVEHETEEEAPERPTGPPPYARWWIGGAGAVDLLSLPTGNDLCVLTPNAVPANGSGYYCTNPDGSDFPTRANAGQNSSLIPGQSGTVGGGLHGGDVRILLAVDYALTSSILVGGRIGAALNTYPGSQAVKDHHAFGSKLDWELRGTYVFGDAPLTREGFAPTVFAAAGMAEFDGHTASVVSMTSKAAVPTSQPVNIWLTNGPWFLALGGGARYQFSPRFAFNMAARLNVAFGGAGALFSYGPELTLQYGF